MSSQSGNGASNVARPLMVYANTIETIGNIVEEYGILHTVRTAAGLVHVSRQRIHQLFQKGRLTRFVLFEEPHVSDRELWIWAGSRRRRVS